MPDLRLVSGSRPAPPGTRKPHHHPAWWLGRAQIRVEDATEAVLAGRLAMTRHHLILAELYIRMTFEQLGRSA